MFPCLLTGHTHLRGIYFGPAFTEQGQDLHPSIKELYVKNNEISTLGYKTGAEGTSPP